MAQNNFFFSITTADKRSALENSWEDALKENNGGDLRKILRCRLRETQSASESGQVLQSSSSNGHSGSYANPGEGAPAAGDYSRMWQSLVDLYDESFRYVSFCCKYGLDAFKTLKDDCKFFPPFPPVVEPQVIVDETGEWIRLAVQFSIDQSKFPIVNVAVAPASIFLFMMYRLVAVTESRADYGDLRLVGGYNYA